MDELTKELLLNHFQYLWKTKGRYRLIKVDPGYVIHDILKNSTLIIEEDDAYQFITQKMVEEGCEIVDVNDIKNETHGLIQPPTEGVRYNDMTPPL